MISHNIISQIKTNRKYTAGCDKIYKRFSEVFVEIAYEKNFVRRAAKSCRDRDNDIDSLAAEKVERHQQNAAGQAELDVMDHKKDRI